MDFKEAIELMKKGKIVKQVGGGNLFKIVNGYFYIKDDVHWVNGEYYKCEKYSVLEIEKYLNHEYEEYIGYLSFKEVCDIYRSFII